MTWIFKKSQKPQIGVQFKFRIPSAPASSALVSLITWKSLLSRADCNCDGPPPFAAAHVGIVILSSDLS
jgi:hypothetical protein